MRFKMAIFIAVILIMVVAPSGQDAGAIDVVPFDPAQIKTDSPVLITAYAVQGPRVEYVQLFNTSTEVIDLENWKVSYTIGGQSQPVEIGTLSGLLKPSDYVLLADGSVPSADFPYILTIPAGVTANATTIILGSPLYLNHTVTVNTTNHYWQRNRSATTGNYLSTFSALLAIPSSLFGGGLYEYPDQTMLQFSEVLANPRSCSPLDAALDCRDYVKLFNPTDQAIDLSLFRLRVGYQGQSSSSSNTYSLSGTIEPGHFAVINSSSDNRPISITNSGGFVWLEDAYGIKRYDNTVQEYADASAESKKGQAWAYDPSDGAWKWTTQPTPLDVPSVFPPAIAAARSTTLQSLTPCKEGQYRSEDTNRCRNIASASVLVPCKDGQYRSEETNRCRSILAEATLTPCLEGQERNLETNRCRKKASSEIPEAAFAVEEMKEAGKAFAGWWALGGIGTLALGRGIWEWRSEVLAGIRKIGSFFTSSK